MWAARLVSMQGISESYRRFRLAFWTTAELWPRAAVGLRDLLGIGRIALREDGKDSPRGVGEVTQPVSTLEVDSLRRPNCKT
jgi:hypothetical protein